MAAVSVTFDGTRIDAAQSDGGGWTDLGGGKAVTEPDFVYQGGASVSEKVGTSEGGVAFDDAGTTDFSTTAQVWIAKHIATNFGVLNAKGSTGGILEIGSGGRRSDYDRYYVVGSDTYPIKGGWLITPIDPNGTPSATPGTAPTLTAIDYFGWACTFSASSKSENVAMDAIDYVANGAGLTLVGGDGVSADGTFGDFVTTDEGTSGNRWGIVSTSEGVLFVTGVLTIGTATETDFADSGVVVVWPDAEFLNSTGFFGLDIGLQNASSVIDISGCSFISRGTSGGAVDTRAVFEVTGTSGALTLDACTFQNMYDFVLTSGATVTGCSIETRAMTQGSADVSGCTITTNSASSVACLTDPTFGTTTDLHDCEFVFGSGGHALELSTVGASVTLTNITFTGYGATGTASSAIDVTAATGTTTINWSGGTEPTYTTAGATVLVVNSVTVTVEVLAAAGGSAISSARVLLLADTGGPLPAGASVTITRSGSTASVAHTSHGLSNGDEVQIKGADQDEYNGIKTISNVTTNAYDFTVAGTPTTPATGTITATSVILNADSNGSGIVTDTGFPFSSDQPVTGRVRKGSASPYYKTTAVSGTITSGGFSSTVFMVSDE